MECLIFMSCANFNDMNWRVTLGYDETFDAIEPVSRS